MSDEIRIIWTNEAEERLKKLPFFLRGMIKGNTEKYAEDNGISVIGVELLDELRKKRFGDKMPEMPVNDVVERQEKAEVRGQMSEVRRQRADAFPWTKEARRRLDSVPEFMRGMFKEAVEEFAGRHGHLEVNVDVWERFEEVSGQKQEVNAECGM